MARDDHPTDAIDWLAVATGVVLLVCVLALRDFYGFTVRFGGPQSTYVFPLTYVSDGEALLWVTALVLVTPACFAIAFGLRAQIARAIEAAAGLLERVIAGRPLGTAVVFTLALAIVYRLGRRVLLRDHMVTDDETMARFGGQMLAAGRLSIERPWPEGTFTELYTFVRDGQIASMDWPGALVFAALSEATGLEALAYAAFAAVGAAAVCAAAHRIAGAKAAWVAGVIWLVSPMVWTLSLTRHSHLVSRTCVALAFLACARLWCAGDRAGAADDGSRAKLGWALLLGVAVGASFTCRPAETAAMMAPAGAFLAWRAVRGGAADRGELAVVALGVAPFVAGFLAYDHAMTGDALVPPRFFGSARAHVMAAQTIWDRFGSNLSFSTLMLGIWFLGLAGLPLAWLGVRRAGVMGGVLFGGVCAQLLLALAHSNVGIHMVGPIHYSETAVPLVLLTSAAIVGVRRELRGPRARGWLRTAIVGQLAAMAIFGALYAESLAGLGRVSDMPASIVREAGLTHAIVLAPPPFIFERRITGSPGSWQQEHPPPDPLLGDDVLWVNANASVRDLRRAFPQRTLHRLTADEETGEWSLRRVGRKVKGPGR